MLDNPPPSTMTSGSIRLMMTARPRAKPLGVAGQRRDGEGLAGGGAGGDAGRVAGIGAVAVHGQAGA